MNGAKLSPAGLSLAPSIPFKLMNQGFTFIELAVVMFITVLLSAALVLGTSTAGTKMALKRAAYDLAQNLREVQEMSMSAKKFDCDVGMTSTVGLHAKQKEKSYVLFADCSQNPDKYTFENTSQDRVLKEVYLESGVKICKIDAPAPKSKANICFVPPDPIVNLNGEAIDNLEVIIDLCLESDEDIIKRVIVNSVGMIEIE